MHQSFGFPATLFKTLDYNERRANCILNRCLNPHTLRKTLWRHQPKVNLIMAYEFPTGSSGKKWPSRERTARWGNRDSVRAKTFSLLWLCKAFVFRSLHPSLVCASESKVGFAFPIVIVWHFTGNKPFASFARDSHSHGFSYRESRQIDMCMFTLRCAFHVRLWWDKVLEDPQNLPTKHSHSLAKSFYLFSPQKHRNLRSARFEMGNFKAHLQWWWCRL